MGVSYKPVYDEREGADLQLTWQLCFHEMVQTIPVPDADRKRFSITDAEVEELARYAQIIEKH